jgi:CubicO group peptidase (beta-lactamase class C family)
VAVTEQDISAELEVIRAKFGLPALGAALFSDTKVLAIGASGVRAMKHPEKVTVDDLWHLGSCTKAMTATLIGTMVEKGELSWDQTLEESLPNLAKDMHADFRKVTIRQLLTMSGGIPTDLSFDGLWGKLWERKGTFTDQRRELARAVLTRAPVNKPGTTMLYANASVAIAGLIAEEKTGIAWEELVTQRVFAPLGITKAGFGAPGDRKEISQPRGHLASDDAKEPGTDADNPPAIGPAGTVHMSMRDWAKFLMAHARSGEGTPALLKPETFKLLHTPILNGYGMGWGTAERGWGGHVITHSGSNTMWYCVTWVSPEKKFGVLVCTNTAQHNAAGATDEAAAMLIRWQETHPSTPR